MGLKLLMLAAGMILSAEFAFADNGRSLFNSPFKKGGWRGIFSVQPSLWGLVPAVWMLLIASVCRADNGTEWGVMDDFTVWGVEGSTADADVEIKGFTVFGSTTDNNLAVYNGTGSVFMGGALEVSSNTYLRGSVVVGTTPSQGIFAVKDNLVVTSGGNVGIGTANPIAGKMVISRGGGAPDLVLSPDIWNDTYGVGIRVTGGTDSNNLRLLPDNGTVMIIPPDGVNAQFILYNKNATEIPVIINGNGNSYFNGGNVGIGTVNPAGLFQVGGGTLTALSNGNIGIGTTNPRRTLDIQGLAGIGTNNAEEDATIANRTGLMFNDGIQGWNYPSATIITEKHGDYGGDLIFGTRSSAGGPVHERMRIIGDPGNVGIGTTNPSGKLSVHGTGTYALFVSTDSAGSVGNLVVDNSGNVGIGTTEPKAALHVVGVSSITASITVGGVENASIPRNAVMFFYQATCPTGWSPLEEARGRYLVGVLSGQTVGGTAGIAFTQDKEDRPTGTHTHTASQATHHQWNYKGKGAGAWASITNTDPNSGSAYGSVDQTDLAPAITVNAVALSTPSTNAPYI